MRNSDRLVAPNAFILIDCVLVAVALAAAFCSTAQVPITTDLAGILSARITVANLLRAAEVFLFWLVLMRCFRVYKKAHVKPLSEAIRIVLAVAATTLVLGASFNGSHRGASPWSIAADFGLFCLLSLFGIRAVVAFLSRQSGTGLLGRRSVLIVGTGPRAVRAFRYVRTQLHRSHCLLGFVDCRDGSLCPSEVDALYLGPLSSLETILLDRVVDEVIVALPGRSCHAEIQQTIEICSRVGVELKLPEDVYPLPFGTASLNEGQSYPEMLVLRPAPHDMRLVIKRLVDISISALLLILLLPLMVAIAAVVKFTSQGPVFFFQERYGLGRRRFRMVKFRTMQIDAEARLKELESLNEASGPIFKIRHDPRITRVGKFLRRASLDELPQLFNVLGGEMSLVGPRPMSVRDVSLFTEPWLMRRFSVKPGITCLWQVNGRSNVSFYQWMELDLRYVDSWSLSLDARILALTVSAVLKGSGAM